VRYPDRFVDEREREDGMRHWNLFMALIEEANDAYVGLCDPGQGAASPDEKDGDTAISEDAAEVGVQGSMGQNSRSGGLGYLLSF
jgi:hypothetical protein